MKPHVDLLVRKMKAVDQKRGGSRTSVRKNLKSMKEPSDLDVNRQESNPGFLL
mgnify:CR=1 FL=1